MRLRVLRRGADALFRELDGLPGFATELRVEIGRRPFQIHARSAEASEIVIDGDGAASEEDVEPQRRGEGAVIGGIFRVGGDRLAQDGDRFVVIEVVGEIGGTIAHLARRFGARTRGVWQTKPKRDCRRDDWPEAHHEHMIAVLQGAARAPRGSTEEPECREEDAATATHC